MRTMRRTLSASAVFIVASAFFFLAYASAQRSSTHAAICQNIPGTNIPVGAACLPRSEYPVLKNPVNPLNYGADPTGATNSGPAFQEAVNSGHDLTVTCPSGMNSCTYRISDASGRNPIVISSRIDIQCQANVTLYNPDLDRFNSAMLTFYKARGGGVQGCNMIGANSGPPPLNLGGGYSNFLVQVIDSTHVLVEGNTFGNTWADSALKLATGSTGPGATYTLIRFNTFTANPLYGVAITSGGYDTIRNNLIIDSGTGVEANAGEAMDGHILIDQNMEIYEYGGCSALGNEGCDYGIGFTGGGYVDSFSGSNYPYYATNVVTRNYCTGSGLQNAEIYDIWSSYISPPPTYSHNVLGPGCTCASGAGSC